jgi:hypothetical protein
VGLVDDDGEAPAALLAADLVEDERELLHRRDDDLLAGPSMNRRRSPERSACPTVAPTWANCLMVSRICLSRMRRSVTTMIESKTRVDPIPLQPDQLVGQPGDGVGLAAAGRVLDQVALARPVPPASASSRRTTSSWW